MVLLNRNRAQRLLLATMTVLAAGCVLLSTFEQKPKRFAFNHAVHVKEEMECADCHAGAADSDEPGMPVQGQCKLCHEGIDAQKPPERQIAQLFVGGKLQAMHAAKLSDEVKFSHAKHVAAGTECGACHQAIETNEAIEPDMRLSMDDCMTCHASKKAPNDCADCHTKITKEQAPPSHAQAWKQMHGQAVRWPTGKVGDRCELCHTESTCTTCHEEQAPKSHNQFWRIRGHGVAAEMDRQSCATCHRPDTCSRCHADTIPLSHSGPWGAPRDTHCLSCHFPLSDNGCSVCHTDVQSHALATPMPTWHDPGMNCRQCHGVTQPLPHVDDGSTCTTCHR